jgi:hypothetical protein
MTSTREQSELLTASFWNWSKARDFKVRNRNFSLRRGPNRTPGERRGAAQSSLLLNSIMMVQSCPDRRKRTPRGSLAASRRLSFKQATGGPSNAPITRKVSVKAEPAAAPRRPLGPSPRPPVRTTREVFKRLVASLDAALPPDRRSLPRANGAGSRSLGNGGRSLLDVLADVVRAVVALRKQLDQQAVLRSRGAVTVEVEMSDWIITAMSPGAEIFFNDTPWGSVIGQSLTDFVKWEDLADLDSLKAPLVTLAGCDTAPGSAAGSHPTSPASSLSCSSASSSSGSADSHAEHRHIRLMHFTSRPAAAFSSEDSQGQSCQAVLQSSDSSLDGHGDEMPLTLLPPAAAHGWPDAFEHDPMLCDQPAANEVQGRFLAKYVHTTMQLLPVATASPTGPHRALVTISLL